LNYLLKWRAAVVLSGLIMTLLYIYVEHHTPNSISKRCKYILGYLCPVLAGSITCAAYPLEQIDTIDIETGNISKNSALNLVVFGVRNTSSVYMNFTYAQY